MPSKVLGEISHIFPNFNGETDEFGNEQVISSVIF